MIKLTLILIAMTCLSALTECVAEEGPQTVSESVYLSPQLLELLKAEMREIAADMQTIPLLVASADWHAIQSAGKRMKDSYIMAQQLTVAQRQELASALPGRFKHLDSEFHHRAEKLQGAAAARDTELVIFYYSGLLETCSSCHSQFAGSRFPGFSTPTKQAHQH